MKSRVPTFQRRYLSDTGTASTCKAEETLSGLFIGSGDNDRVDDPWRRSKAPWMTVSSTRVAPGSATAVESFQVAARDTLH